MSTVNLLLGWRGPAILVTIVTRGSVSAVRVCRVVAPVVGGVPHHELPVLVRVADQVLGLGVWLQAVPVTPRNSQLLYTPCPQKRDSVFISSISLSNLGQISKSGTVLKSARSKLSKTVPDFEI